MGYYVNPRSGTKEAFLAEHGKRIDPPVDFNWSGGSLPVCLVDNGDFTAAGIAYDKAEADAFIASLRQA